MLKMKTFIVGALSAALAAVAVAQEKTKATAPAVEEKTTPVKCDRDRALALINEQIDNLKMFDDATGRITLTVKAAELLWGVEEVRAREMLEEAYELAYSLFVERTKNPPPMKHYSFNMNEDPRLPVVRAVARKDAAWAKRLSKRLVEETEEIQKLKTETAENSSQTGDNLLNVARSVLPTDQDLALTLARNSLQYQPGNTLLSFLSQFAEVNPAAANNFYREALQVLASGRTKGLLLLSAFAFGQPRIVGPEASYYFSYVTESFNPPAAEQQLFLDAVLHKVDAFAGAPASPSETQEVSEAATLYLALQGLEPLAEIFQPAYLHRLAAAKITISTLLSDKDRKLTAEQWQEQQRMDKETSESILNRAEKEIDADKKDRLIANAVMAKGSTKNPERIESLIKRVTDATLRKQLLSWFAFTRAEHAIGKGRLDEADQYLDGIDETDLRAYLAMKIAKLRLEKAPESQQARDALEPAIALALKAPDGAAKARALFGLTYLYATLDQPRAFSIMNEAVKAVNNTDASALAESMFFREVKGKEFMSFVGYSIAGYSVENTFLGVGEHDFDAALSMALNLSDKTMRSSVIFALAERCLERDLAEKKKREASQKATKKQPGEPAPKSR